MSPPIYTPDGSEVSEIVLPDGSTASEVIGPDGNVVFEAGPDIPDSAISQYKIDEGSGSAISDSIGSEGDGTINGASWVSDANSTGGFELDFDGTDDIVSFPTFSFFDADASGAIGLTVELDSVATNQTFINLYNSTQPNFLSIGTATSTTGGSSGELGTFIRQDTNSSAFSSSSELTTNSKTRLLMNYDLSTTSLDVYKNGSLVSFDGSSNSVARFATELMSSGQNNENTDGRQDNLIFYSEQLTENEALDDYNAQPWV